MFRTKEESELLRLTSLDFSLDRLHFVMRLFILKGNLFCILRLIDRPMKRNKNWGRVLDLNGPLGCRCGVGIFEEQS